MKTQNLRLGTLGARSNSMRCLVILAMMCFSVLVEVSIAQSPSPAQQMQFGSPRTEELTEQATQTQLKRLAADASWKLLTRKAEELGFTARGVGGSVKATGEPVRGRQPSAQVEVFPYAKEGSSDSAGLVNVSEGSNKYYALLVAENGDFENATEWTVRNNEVVKAHSWWRCVLAKLSKECGTPCGGAVVSCVKSDWRAYLLCLAGKCGPCFIQAAIGCIGQ
jgi:hypothetical protein